MSNQPKWDRALVTGASEGIGEAFARELARRGSDLVLVARRKARLEALSRELASRDSVEVETLAVDLTTPDGLAAAEVRLERDERPIDLLVNNAGGLSEFRPFLELDRERLSSDVYLNALTMLRLTHAGAQAMSRRGGGHVINVSAGAAFFPLPYAAAYGASKAFVNSLSAALHYELRDEGVCVTAICPGFTHTGMQTRLGMNVDHLPRAMWMMPDKVAKAGLRAAERNRPVSSLNAIGALNNFIGRHLPPRAVARQGLRLMGSKESAAPRRPRPSNG